MGKLIKIKQKEAQDVYDLTVPETHNFFAEGILVHNCGR
jgi:intein/homing endonuclease